MRRTRNTGPMIDQPGTYRPVEPLGLGIVFANPKEYCSGVPLPLVRVMAVLVISAERGKISSTEGPSYSEKEISIV